MRYWVFITLSAILYLEAESQIPLSAHSSGRRIIALAEKMISVVEKVEDFQCKTEILYYREGKEYKRYRFAFFREKSGNLRLKVCPPLSWRECVLPEGR